MAKHLSSHLNFFALLCSLILLGTYENSFAISKQRITYQYPVRSAKNVPTSSGIGIRVSKKVSISNHSNDYFDVIGSKSGTVKGNVSLSDDGHTVIFTPLISFQPGEKISVVVKANSQFPETSFNFTTTDVIRSIDRKLIDEESYIPTTPFMQLPMDTLPAPSFTVWTSDSPAEGFIFLQTLRPAPNNTNGYLMAVENSGSIRWMEFKPFVSPNFQPHKDGRYSYLQQSQTANEAKFIILDSNLQKIGEVKAPSEYATKLHELLLLPNGHSMLLGRYTTLEDMSAQVPGGQTGVSVDQTAIIEFDSSGNKIFEWRTEDHYKITDATHEDLTAQMINYSFINALSIDNDGQLLASSRRMDEITKINRETGEIIWRLGGKNNQFTMIGDSIWFSHAHNIQALPNGHYLLFDNGLYTIPKVSRAIEYAIDTNAMTVTQVWKFTHPDSIAGDMMGSVQRLDNGNTLIGWGTNTSRTCTEVTPEGKIALDLSMSGTTWSYRAYKAARNLPQTSIVVDPKSPLTSITLYPNPATTSATLVYKLKQSSNVVITIEDCLGRMLKKVVDEFKSNGTYTQSVDVASYPKGVYFCKVHINGEISTSRIIVQ